MRAKLYKSYKSSTLNDTLVIYIGGQSNAGTDPHTGKIAPTDMPSHLKITYTNVFFWDIADVFTGTFAPYTAGSNNMGYIDQMLYILSKVYSNIYVIKRSVGGTKLSTIGNPDSFQRSDFKLRSIWGKDAIEKTVGCNYDAINIWDQCESDCVLLSDATNYDTTLNYWIDVEYRSIINNDWIIKRVGNLTKDFEYRALLATKQEAVVAADVRKRIINTDNLRQLGTNIELGGGYKMGDFSHNGPEACFTIGTRFAEAILNVFNRIKHDIIKPVLQSASINTSGNTLTLTYNKTLNTGCVPFWKHFQVGTKVWANIQIVGSEVTLTPTVPFYSNLTYTFTYIRNNIFNENLQDLFGNEVDNISLLITNNATTSEPTITNLYTSNFSGGLDGNWSTFFNASCNVPQTSISGELNCAQVTNTSSSNGRFQKVSTTGLANGHTYRIKFRIEIPDSYGYPSAPTKYYIMLYQLNPTNVILDFSSLVVRDQMTYMECQFTSTSSGNGLIIESGALTGQYYFIKDIIIDKIGS